MDFISQTLVLSSVKGRNRGMSLSLGDVWVFDASRVCIVLFKGDGTADANRSLQLRPHCFLDWQGGTRKGPTAGSRAQSHPQGGPVLTRRGSRLRRGTPSELEGGQKPGLYVEGPICLSVYLSWQQWLTMFKYTK